MTAVAPLPRAALTRDDLPVLDIRKVGGALGAEVRGLTLGAELDDATATAVQVALAEHQVLFFRDQHHLDRESQWEAAARLGTPTEPHPTVKSRGALLLELEGAANAWHSDVTFVDRVPKASLLRAVTLPPYGGTTVWASTTAAYDALPAPLQVLAEELWALHTNRYDYAEHGRESGYGENAYYQEFTSERFETRHPVVRIHPETGRKSLVLGQFVKHLLDVSPRDSRALLDLLQHRIIRLENTVRWDWRNGDVALWDNRATQHYGVADFGEHRRQLHRVTLAGDIPVDVRGRRSTTVAGDPENYSPVVAAPLLPGVGAPSLPEPAGLR
ncbi:TauD/TfdA family dioxygenase [Nocardia sp. NPDC050697]|uniref:TauD/TfdA dioxygenase family protein n=1 Tax=Nocardia sp. NPDC050697 TaxID=3155158 RepID=UPI0033FA8E07